jgi:hypothetical protein
MAHLQLSRRIPTRRAETLRGDHADIKRRGPPSRQNSRRAIDGLAIFL